MKLVLDNLKLKSICNRGNLQFTLDEDVNVPDVKQDIRKIICSNYRAYIDNINVKENAAECSGKCQYRILYGCNDENKKFEAINGEINFNQKINMDGVTKEDSVKVKIAVEDFTVRIINTRKISIHAIINIEAAAEKTCEAEIATECNENHIFTKKNNIEYSVQKDFGKDVLRVREMVELPQGKPDINKILWQENSIHNKQIRINENSIDVKCELKTFILYDTYNDGLVEWYETNINVNGNIECMGITEDMISDVKLSLSENNITVKTNKDGEDRCILVEAVIDTDIKAYESKTIEYLADLYSTANDIEINKKKLKYQNILMNNDLINKVVGKIVLKESEEGILQICKSDGVVHIDDISIEDDNIKIYGALEAEIMYVTSNDENPIAVKKEAIPIEQNLEIKCCAKNTVCLATPLLEQISANMTGNSEVEIKANVGSRIMVISDYETEFIDNAAVIDEKPQWINDFPGAIGYIAAADEDIWEVAKKYHISEESIKNVNKIKGDCIKKGDKLIIIK